MKKLNNVRKLETEYIGGFSLCPLYSHKQLRKISCSEKHKMKRKLSTLTGVLARADRTVPVQRQRLLRSVHNAEAIF